MTAPREPEMTLADAAAQARTTPEAITSALRSGDLRDLRRSTVAKWIRAQVAQIVTPRDESS